MAKIRIDLKDYTHLVEKSTYNNNYYAHKDANTDTILFVHCDEQYSQYDVYVCSEECKVFIGSAQDFNCDDIYEFNLGEMYT